MFVVLSIFLLSISCKKGSTNNCTDDKYTYEFQEAARIDTLTIQGGLFYQINPGNNIVFNYTHTGPNCKNLADEEYVENLVFQIPAGTTNFIFQNNQITNAFCFFKKTCFCNNFALPVISGNIKGTKISTVKWKIEINIDVPGSTDKIILDKFFVLP